MYDFFTSLFESVHYEMEDGSNGGDVEEQQDLVS